MVVIEVAPVDSSARTPATSQSFGGPVITIGRCPQADVFLDGDMISRLAIRLVLTEGGMVLEDASENGTTVNGVHGWGARPIREGDDIRIGPYRLAVKRTA